MNYYNEILGLVSDIRTYLNIIYSIYEYLCRNKPQTIASQPSSSIAKDFKINYF